MTITRYLLIIIAAFMLTACENETSTELQDSIDEVTPETAGEANPTALFDPSDSVIPFPNNLLFTDTTDGTLNIPVTDPNDLSDPQVALNNIDGFSTVAPMSAGFSTSIDDTSISGTSVKMYEVSLTSGAVTDIVSQLTYGVDFVAAVSTVDSSQSTLAIVLLRPLDEKTSYMMVITDDLLTASGKAFAPSLTYQLIKELNDPAPLTFGDPTLPGALQSLTLEEFTAFDQLRLLINAGEATVSVDPDGDQPPISKIIQSWSFTTQSIGDVLAQERSDIINDGPATVVLADSGTDSALNAADIWVGTLQVPYYLTAASGVNDPTPLASFWQGAAGSILTQLNPDAVPTSTETIPVMLSVPKSAEPTNGYPIVIYQHGITTNRATMLAVADSLALAGLAVVAIDLPMHGLTGNETDGTEGFYQAGLERTFDLDLVDNATSLPVPDGITDASGTHFINLTNLLNTRDNVRQAVADLITLQDAISAMNAGGSTFDTNRVYFLGHSLGAMVGTTFLALEPNVRDTALAFGGVSLPKILDGSAAFSPQIVAGLAAAGVNKGTADYESFFAAAQTVVDTVDPVNHATAAAPTNRGVVYFEIVGGPTSPSDLVVPNTVPDANDTSNTVAAPLAGTEPALTLMGLTQVNSDQNGGNLKHSVKFVVGNHSSLLSDAADPFNDQPTNAAVRTEIQTIAATFLASDGNVVDITDDTLLQAPTP